MRVITNIQWQDPDGNFHEPGEVADVNVFDLDDLIARGTVEKVNELPPTPEPPRSVRRAAVTPESEE